MHAYVCLGLILAIFLSSCNQNTESKKTNQPIDSAGIMPAEPASKTEIPERNDLLKQISSLEKELYATQELDLSKAKKMISLYDTYCQQYYKYPECAEFLFKAGELAENSNQAYRAIGFYTKCYEEYPAFKMNDLCLFRMANLYDYKLSNYIKAKALYMEVKEQFPKSPIAKDADAALRLMGKSDQEMIKEFEKKNGIKKK